MILDIGQLSDVIQVTAQYSNAVMVAVLPHFSDVAQKLDLPVPVPITQAAIDRTRIWPDRMLGAEVLLTNGCGFEFFDGYVKRYNSPRSPAQYPPLPDPVLIPPPKKLTQEEAVVLARDCIRKLGIPLEAVFADREPYSVGQLGKWSRARTNAVLRWEIRWTEPRSSVFPSVRFVINPETREVEQFSFGILDNLRRPLPELKEIPPNDPNSPWASHEKINPDYAWKLIPIMFKAIDEYGEKLSLPVPRPLTTNDVARVHLGDNGGWPHCEIWLNNGWMFLYRHAMVNGYYSSKVFFSSDGKPYRAKDYEGKMNLTTNQAMERVKLELAKLDYPTNHIHMDFPPFMVLPAGLYEKTIPRCWLRWEYAPNGSLQSVIEAEVNLENGKVEVLKYDDKAYWNDRPPIDVPIALPPPGNDDPPFIMQSPATNPPPAKASP